MNFRKRLLIIIGIPIGISLVLAIALVYLGSDIVKQTTQIKQLREELAFRVHITDSLASLRKDSEQAQSYLFVLEKFLPTRDQLVTFPRDLGVIARASGADLSAVIGQEAPRAPGAPGTTEVTITGQTSFENLINFFKNLENSYYFVRLTKLDLTRQNSGFRALLAGQVFSF